MADNYRAEICSTGGKTWWNPKQTATSSLAAGGNNNNNNNTRFEETGAVSCSYDDSAGSGSGNSDIGSSISDSTLQLPLFGLSPSASSIDWSQTLLRSNEKAITSINNMAYYHHDQQTLDSSSSQVHVAGTVNSGINSFNQGFVLDQPRVGSCPNSDGTNETGYENLGSVTYNYPSIMVNPGLLEASKLNLQQSIYNEQSAMGYAEFLQPSTTWGKFSKQNPMISNQLQLCNDNDAPFWSSNSAVQPQFVAQSLEPKSANSSLIEKLSRDGAQVSCPAVCKKSTDSEPGFKKPRIETPSPLPTFKVRKEKLGDRITALQQLVSPFGKTDTASVLHEAIEYIKFLHDQVAVLSTPYMKNGSPNPVQQQQQQVQQVSGMSIESEGPKQDLRSRGLCLVPVASTYPVASETATDFWHPTFGGTFR